MYTSARVVYDPNGQWIVTETSDRFRSIVLVESGDYIIRLTPATVGFSAAYVLDLRIYGPVDGALRPPIERIQFARGAVSATLNDTLYEGQLKQYAFYAFVGQTATLNLDHVNAYVIAPDQTIIAINTQYMQPTVLPLTGDYLITLYDVDNLTAQPYQLQLTITGATDGIAEPERIRFASGAISARMTGTVSHTDAADYVFYAFEGQSTTLSLSSATMTVVSPSGIPLARGTVAENLQYVSTILPETGDYRVRVFRNADQPATDYTLDLIIVNP